MHLRFHCKIRMHNNMNVPQSENSKEELLKSNTSMQYGEYPELRLQTT